MTAPVVDTPIANQTNTEKDSVSLDVSGNFSDADVSDKITYSISGLPTGTGLSINSTTGVISGTPTTFDTDAAPYTITVTGTDNSGNADSISFLMTTTVVNDPTPPPPSGELPAFRGLHGLWGQRARDWEGTLNDSRVKGQFTRQAFRNAINDGNYNNFAQHDYGGTITYMQKCFDAGKAGTFALDDKKDETFKKWFIYADNATGKGNKRFEIGNWIGAWWGQDGEDCMVGLAKTGIYAYTNAIPKEWQPNVIGVRINTNAIAAEGTSPASTLHDIDDTNDWNGVGANTTETRAQVGDYTNEIGDTTKGRFLNRVLDHILPNGDSGDSICPTFFRIRYVFDTEPAATRNRFRNLFNTNKIFPMVTAGHFEPQNGDKVKLFNEMHTACVVNGNKGGYVEPFDMWVGNVGGADPTYTHTQGADSKTLANFTHLQLHYWMALCSLDYGATYHCWRIRYLLNLSRTDISADLRGEWQAIADFINEYAGTAAEPNLSPGAWVALREGQRRQGNYTHLAEQVLSANAQRGTILYAGANGTSFPAPAVLGGYANPEVALGPGAGTNKGNSVPESYGEGDRQSIWAGEFAAGDKLKIKLNQDFANRLHNKSCTVNVHYLDENAAGGSSFTVDLFGTQVSSVNVTGTQVNGWKIDSTDVADAGAVSADADGAHVVLTFSGGPTRIHMVEVKV